MVARSSQTGPPAPPGKAAIVIERREDGIRVDLAGLLSAYERRWRRWRAAFQWGLVLGALAFLAFGFWWERAEDQEKRRMIGVLKFDLAEQRARASCWQAIAMHPLGYGSPITLERRPAEVNKCVEQELKRWVATKNGKR